MKKIFVSLLLIGAPMMRAGQMDLFIDLNPTSSGFKSLMSYSWTTGLLEFDPRNLAVHQEISNAGAIFDFNSAQLSFSHNLVGVTTIEPPVCFQGSVDVTVTYAVYTPETFSKVTSQMCYQGPPKDGPVNGPGTCNDPSCMGSWEPLVLDLNGDGINTAGINDMVWFDLDGDGVKDHLTWTNGNTMEGFLWVNLTGKNRVDNGSELFGIGTVLRDGTRAKDGFQALSMYDDAASGGNGDGVIDANDAVWNKLRVWTDANHDGVCDPTEVNPIQKYGIEGISLLAERTNFVDSLGNGHYLRGHFWRRVDKHLRVFDIDGLTFQKAN